MPSKISYKLDMENPTKIEREVVRRVMPRVTDLIAGKARQLAPKRTGKLMRSIVTKMQQGGEVGIVAAKAPHAHLIHEGVKPHEVTLEKKKAMKFVSDGKVFIRKLVKHHPGIVHPTPFLTDAADQSKGDVDAILKGAI